MNSERKKGPAKTGTQTVKGARVWAQQLEISRGDLYKSLKIAQILLQIETIKRYPKKKRNPIQSILHELLVAYRTLLVAGLPCSRRF